VTDQNFDIYIDKLAGELSPVKVHWSAEKRSLLWFVLHVSWICGLGLSFSHLNDFNFSDMAYRTNLVLEISLFVIAIILTSFSSFVSMVPGRLNKTASLILILVGPFILLTLFAVKMMTMQGHMLKSSMLIGCEFQIILYSLPPIFHLYYMIRNGEHFYSKRTFLSIGMASALIPSALMHIICMGDYKHVVIFHLGTSLLITLLTVWAMKKSLKT
jgi:hypothetical protein